MADDVLTEVASKIDAALDKANAGLRDDFPEGLAEAIAGSIQSRKASLQIGIGG